MKITQEEFLEAQRIVDAYEEQCELTPYQTKFIVWYHNLGGGISQEKVKVVDVNAKEALTKQGVIVDTEDCFNTLAAAQVKAEEYRQEHIARLTDEIKYYKSLNLEKVKI